MNDPDYEILIKKGNIYVDVKQKTTTMLNVGIFFMMKL